jgi:hypothetical protein
MGTGEVATDVLNVANHLVESAGYRCTCGFKGGDVANVPKVIGHSRGALSYRRIWKHGCCWLLATEAHACLNST